MRLTRKELFTFETPSKAIVPNAQTRFSAVGASARTIRRSGLRAAHPTVGNFYENTNDRQHGGETQAASFVLMFGGAVLRAIADAEHASTGDVLLGGHLAGRVGADRVPTGAVLKRLPARVVFYPQ